MKKKYIVLAVVCILVATAAVISFTSISDRPLTMEDTFGDAQKLLKAYMKKHGVQCEIGSQEFMEFAVEQTTGDVDPAFETHSDYEYMRAYLIRYREMYFDYALCMENFKISTEAGEELLAYYEKDNPCLVYNKETKELRFVLTKEFLNTTFEEYKNANFEKLNR